MSELTERFFLESEQTLATPTVKDFANRHFPKGFKTKKDLENLVAAVKEEIVLKRNLAGLESQNEGLNELLDELNENEADLTNPVNHAILPGVRTAEEVLEDRFSSAHYPCTDFNTVIMAVLRSKGVPCRLTRIVSITKTHQTSYTELELNGRHYRIHPVKEGIDGKHVREGLLEERKEQKLITAKDHQSSNVNLKNAILALNQIRGRP